MQKTNLYFIARINKPFSQYLISFFIAFRHN